jgi:phosphoribosylformimino-5-aminoimidazole carboxamide ribotide isomerase
VEGKSQGIEEPLIELLGAHSPLPVTYAGGVSRLEDLDLVKALGQNRVDLTIGSALDIFGGKVRYMDVLKWVKDH